MGAIIMIELQKADSPTQYRRGWNEDSSTGSN